MDGDNYGEAPVIDFPKDKLVFGPSQVEARITNDPVISAQLTLVGPVGERGDPRQSAGGPHQRVGDVL